MRIGPRMRNTEHTYSTWKKHPVCFSSTGTVGVLVVCTVCAVCSHVSRAAAQALVFCLYVYKGRVLAIYWCRSPLFWQLNPTQNHCSSAHMFFSYTCEKYGKWHKHTLYCIQSLQSQCLSDFCTVVRVDVGRWRKLSHMDPWAMRLQQSWIDLKGDNWSHPCMIPAKWSSPLPGGRRRQHDNSMRNIFTRTFANYCHGPKVCATASSQFGGVFSKTRDVNEPFCTSFNVPEATKANRQVRSCCIAAPLSCAVVVGGELQ